MSTSIISMEMTEQEGKLEKRKSTSIENIARRTLFRLLGGVRKGLLIFAENGREFRFGEKSPEYPLEAKVEVHDPGFYRRVLFGGSIGAGESYMDDEWSTKDLTDVVRIIVANQTVMNDMDGGWARVSEPFNKMYHWLRRNTKIGSRKNIAAHYDVGNDFYELFLDPTMTYSSGIFENEKSTMEEASLAKYERLCRKLDLNPGDHVLEIGCGWGGFAIYAAENYGCRITATTISDRQYEMAKFRIDQAGLTDRVALLKQDYRDLEGRFDKVVSIEMIEAVGYRYFEVFFDKCSRLLKPEGLFAMQAITIADHLFEQYKSSADFIQRYIFPGGCLPSVAALNLSAASASDMKLFNLEDFTPHYARTLKKWRESFFENIEKVRALGYPESFIRMWEFYFSYCEAGFLERYIGVVQMVFAKPLNRREPIFS